MAEFEYKVVPAPVRGQKARGAKSTEARFAHALSELMNALARDGWEYMRSDTLPCEERVGLTGRATKFQNMLVFRRKRAESAAAPARMISFVSEAPSAANAPDDALAEALGAPLPEKRPSFVRRVAETLSVRPREGRTPAIRAEAPAGAAPKLGGASKESGAAKPSGNGFAAE